MWKDVVKFSMRVKSGKVHVKSSKIHVRELKFRVKAAKVAVKISTHENGRKPHLTSANLLNS
ncbi:hypothetical protein Plano_0499 [Planococcus sp. PAMC 21323]|uniref:hypothetical protein n=1 Tax=Planococcus sp. PAMC 21323 TaxID=1526927 RepID=UPI00056E1DA6|nr:hypothetical protein [Planococcus sp. PAMC 21323]AIY04464.1 hypothetical protein Plano_0499 [Planococcus sp. PAMC 21323]